MIKGENKREYVCLRVKDATEGTEGSCRDYIHSTIG